MMFSPDDFAHLKIPFEDILSAINNFEGRYTRDDFGSTYYRGQLLWSGELIEINARRFKKKRFDEIEQQFWMEIFMLSSLKHKNLVSLVGFCDENDEKIIITRRETRGRLGNYLSDPLMLTWVRRLEISLGVAQALSYIHYDESRDFSVIHRNISPYTVELNDDWEPKLGDFIRSMKIKASERHNSFHTDSVWYMKGYTDPTYEKTKSLNHKSDIYSFGMVLFELLCGRKSVIKDVDNKYLAPVAIFHYREKLLDDIIDPELRKQMDLQSFNVFAETAYDCLNEEQSQRPNMDQIVTRLEKALELQLECENTEHSSSVVAQVGETSSSDEEGSASHFTSTGVESNSSKTTMSSFQYHGYPLKFKDILEATKYFATENIIKETKACTVYQGRIELIDIVAWKIPYKKDDIEKFKKMVPILYSLKHKNLVSYLGYCEQVENFIIWKKEAKGSLNKYLSDQTLRWTQRLKICLGVANALSYIHYNVARNFSVIHCNIRSSKILLDDKWEPKLSRLEHSLINTVARRNRLLLTRTQT